MSDLLLVDPDSPDLRESARLMLRRHEEVAPEADVRSAIADFLVTTGLAARDEIRMEQDRIDLQTGDFVIEVKKRIGTGINPNPKWVSQLDGYLRERARAGERERLGVLTDGRYWILRQSGIEEVRTAAPYGFEIPDADVAYRLYEWLRNESQAFEASGLAPTDEEVQRAFGEGPRAEMELAELQRLYEAARDSPTVVVKLELWRRLLSAALGTVVDEEEDLARQFIRHTYLSAVVGMALQAAFGIDVKSQAVKDVSRLLTGETFFSETGLRGVVESDFFAWPVEVEGGDRWLTDLAGRVSKFDWAATESDVARILYQSIVPAADRKRLGEYYTPDWLAREIVEVAVTDPLNQRVLDPSCGSGTFLFAAVRRYVTAARSAGRTPGQIVGGLQQAVTGVDVHPVAVHLARATWVIAARDAITELGTAEDVTIPVYLGDSLQLRTETGSLLAGQNVTIEVEGDPATGDGPSRLEFPRALVEQSDWFDGVMYRIGDYIESGLDPQVALDEADIPAGPERSVLERTIGRLMEFHERGRDHIWAYYTRNLVRPAWLSSEGGKVDVIVGNPPWLTYSRTDATVRSELESLSKQTYGIWEGGRYAPHQDISGLFYTRCLDLYLRDGGIAAMVMPHSALQTGQFRRWRTGSWRRPKKSSPGGRRGRGEPMSHAVGADLSVRHPWDLEQVEPNDFFPVPSCVVFARKVAPEEARSMRAESAIWRGPVGGPFDRSIASLTDTGSGEFASPYAERARQGATIVPRALFFVNVSESHTAIAPDIVQVSPRRGSKDKAPWSDLRLDDLEGHIESDHLWPVHLGETLAPYVLLDPLSAVLPVRRGDRLARSEAENAVGAIDPVRLGPRTRKRWLTAGELWEENKTPGNKLDLLEQLDYMGKLRHHLEAEPGIRLVYATSGKPTAAVMHAPGAVLDCTLFGVPCESLPEARFLASVINAPTVEEAVGEWMPKGQFGSRHVHKHLWRLAIPEFDASNARHVELAELGERAEAEAAELHLSLLSERAAAGRPTTVTTVRSELRAWLHGSDLGRRIDRLVARLLERGLA
ncbi:MAG: N-6 DNA methylase [bacterium]|nr:N-6 DNA methylase [bacterium]